MDDITRSLVELSVISCLCSPTMSRPATATSVSVEFFTTPLLPKATSKQVRWTYISADFNVGESIPSRIDGIAKFVHSETPYWP